MNSHLDSLMDQAVELIKKAENVYICSHVQPDGDNIGSTLALYMAIEKIKENVNVIKVDEIPSDFFFLPNIQVYKEYTTAESVDLFISLDSSDIERLGAGKELLKKANKVINIDHHATNDNFGDVNIVLPTASATGEIVYKFIKHMGVEIDKDIATCLYTAISMDTGRFMYSNTSYETHLIASELLKVGIDLNSINIHLYQNRSIERTKLFLEALYNMEFHLDGKIGLVVVTQEMLAKNNAKLEDTEGIVSFIRDTGPVEVACLLKEIAEKEVKVSLRSKQHVDVSKIALHFGGGGHIRAAGCTIYDTIDNAKKLVLDQIYKSFR